MEKMLSCKEYAQMMGLHEVSVRRMCERGELPAKKLGAVWRIRHELEEKQPKASTQEKAARNLHAALKNACAIADTALTEYEEATQS